MFVPITHPLETLQQLPDAIGADELLERSYLADLPFTLEQLRTLKAIAIEGSFVRAADRLYLSQPTVSLQVQNLERHLGISLFHRTKRQAQLTEAGQVLVNYGDHILTLCQETCRVLKDLQNLQGGTLVVGASQTPGNYLMPRLIDLFRQKYPGVAVQLHVYSTCQTCWSVMNGQLDLAIVEGEIPVELQDSLKVISYTEDELVLVTPAYHPLAQLGSIQKADLYQLQFIALDSQSTTRKVIDQKLARCGIDNQRLKLSMELNSIESIKNAVQEGLGVAFVSTLAIEKELQLGTLCRVHVEDVVIKRVVSAIFSLNSYYSKAAETFSREILPKFATLEMAKPLSNPVHFVDLD